jgi:hypothetical protein
MRRINAIVVTCLCAITGCKGSDAAEPYGSLLVAPRAETRGLTAALAPAAQAPEAEATVSAVDAPWAIALLSDDRRSAIKRARRAMVVRRDPVVVEPIAGWATADIEVVLGEDEVYARPAADEKPRPGKACSGVVNRRS